MLINLISLVILVALVVLFAWLTRRAWRAKRAWVKFPGILLAGLVTLLLALVAIMAGIGMWKVYVPRNVPVAQVKVAGTPEQIARGEHIANVMCAECHNVTGQLPLSGGRNISEQFNLPLGDVVPVNLTPAGPVQDWSDGEIIRAIRQGIDKNGHPLFAMSGLAEEFGNFGDEDAQALVAYLRNSPRVENQTPEESLSFIAILLVGTGLVPDAPARPGPITAPPKAATAEYAQYIISYAGCNSCHGKDFTGGSGGLSPIGPNLTVLVPKWTREEFIQTMRTGVDPTGHPLSDAMPWKYRGRMDDEELTAMYVYLHGLTPTVKK
jgi:mono/diheme cytochrome c family protein